MSDRRRTSMGRCCGKVMYTSHRLAMKVADKMRGLEGEDVHCFRCPRCGKIHIGHVMYSVQSKAS